MLIEAGGTLDALKAKPAATSTLERYSPKELAGFLNALWDVEAPLSEDRGFTLTVRQLFQGAKPPERHRPYKVCAADLFPVPPCSRNSAS